MASPSASPPSPSAESAATTSSTAMYEVVPHGRKATIWELFEKIKLLEDGTFKARCTLCGKHLALGGNSTLQRHVASCTSTSAPKERQAPTSPTPPSPSVAATSFAATSSAATSSTATYEVVSHKHKAPVWENFEKIKLLSDGTFKARCKLCGKHLALGGNSTLQRHVLSCTSPEESQACVSPPMSPSPTKKIKKR